MPFDNWLPGKVYTCATTPGVSDTRLGFRPSLSAHGIPPESEAVLPCRTRLTSFTRYRSLYEWFEPEHGRWSKICASDRIRVGKQEVMAQRRRIFPSGA